MDEYQRLMQEQRRGTSAQFPMLPPELQPSGEDPLRGAGFGELTDEQKEALSEERALAQKMKDRSALEGVSDYGKKTLSEAPGRIARGAEGLYQLTDEAATAALAYPPKVFADPLGEARKVGVAAAEAQQALVDLSKAVATGDPEAIRTSADLASMKVPIADVVSALASFTMAAQGKDPAENVLWGTLSLATLPFAWLSSNALRKAAKSGIRESGPAQSLQSSLHNLDNKMTNQLKKVDDDLAAGKLTPEKADLYRTQIETHGRRLVGEAETKYTSTLAREIERSKRLDVKKLKPQRTHLLETLMPPGTMATFRAYPDTEATKNARSVAEGINRRLNAHARTGRRITPDQAREELKQMSAYAEHAERQAGDVVGQAQESAIYATRTRKQHKTPDDPRVDPTDAQRQVAQQQAESTSVRQGLEREKDIISGTGKNRVVRKIRPGARLNLEEKRRLYLQEPRATRGDPPKLTDDDYYLKGTTPKPYQEGAKTGRMAPESTEFEPLHLKRIREREELLAAKKKVEEPAFDPLSTEIRKAGQRTGDTAAEKARYQAERRAMRRDEQWNDAELALIEANPGGGNPQLVEERLRKLRQEGKRVVQKEDGSFVISGERSLIGGEDMPDVDPDFLKSGKESDARMGRQRGPVGPARDVKLSPEELSTLRREQIRRAKPLASGFASPADKLRDLNTQIRDIEAKLDAAKTLERRFPGVDDGTLQRELRNDLAQALDGREQLLREGRKPPRGRFAEIDELEAEADRLLEAEADRLRSSGALTEGPAAAAVRRKVKALLALAGSANEHEAMAAMGAAHRLMQKHNIDVAAKSSRGGRRADVAAKRIETPPPTDPRAINRTRRERLAEASEARADVEKPKTVDSLPRLGKAKPKAVKKEKK